MRVGWREAVCGFPSAWIDSGGICYASRSGRRVDRRDEWLLTFLSSYSLWPTLTITISNSKAGYLFPEIARRVRAFSDEHPESERSVGPLRDRGRHRASSESRQSRRMHRAIDELAHRETFRGYGPEQGYEFLRHAIAEKRLSQKGAWMSRTTRFSSPTVPNAIAAIFWIFSGDQNRIAVVDPVYPVYVDTNVMAGHTGPADEIGAYEGLVYLPCTKSNALFRRSRRNASISSIFAFRTIQPVRWRLGSNSKAGLTTL